MELVPGISFVDYVRDGSVPEEINGGTPAYISPEEISGGRPTEASAWYGGPLQIPGPLMRVREGPVIQAFTHRGGAGGAIFCHASAASPLRSYATAPSRSVNSQPSLCLPSRRPPR
jgi:hypothetical protein